MNLSSLKEPMYTIDPSDGSSVDENVDNAVEVKEEPEEVKANLAPAEVLWVDSENGARTYKFLQKDLERAVSCLIKRGTKFTRKYDVRGLSITMQDLSDREQAELNDYRQLIENKGSIRWQKITQELDNEKVEVKDSKDEGLRKVLKIQTETQNVVHADSSRALRTLILCFAIKEIDGEDLTKLSVEKRDEFLSDYNSDLLDWLYYSIYMHFKSLTVEAMKQFQSF